MKAFVLIVSVAVTLSTTAAYAYDPQGSGKVSNGSCNCKTNCDQFAKSGQLTGAKLAQCKADCEQKYAGCNKGAQR
jgi:hypothetical protein